MTACKRELGTIEADLTSALEAEDPLAALTNVMDQAKAVVDRYFKSGVWPWPIGPDGAEVDEQIAKQAEELCTRYKGGWKVAQ
jgi:hypothetical protein